MRQGNLNPNWRPWNKAGIAARRRIASNPEWGRYMRRVKGARRAHITIRASGRVPGEEARAARKRNAAARREAKELAARGLAPARYSYGDLTGT